MGILAAKQAAPASDQGEGDTQWLMVFLNLLLVLLAMFIMRYSDQQIEAAAVSQPEESNRFLEAEQLLAENQRKALELMERLDALLQARNLAGVTVDLHRGKPRIVLSSGVVFASGEAQLNRAVMRPLEEVADLLRPLKKNIMVEGHTDDKPLRRGRFSSNWELSTARALSVVRLFIGRGIQPHRLKFVGFGKYRPRVPNDSEQNRRLNRRIEIKVQ